MTFQDLIFKLSQFWASQGCLIQQPLDLEVGAGTSHPETTLRVLGPRHWNVAYVQPSRRPDDGRFGENPNRLFKHHQFQVIMKPAPDEIQSFYLQSLEACGIEPRRHDIRFEEDNWESPTLGAWGIGWQVMLDGLEITQFTYFQQVGGIDLKPVSVEITYGLERLAMFLQRVDNVYDLQWAPGVTYREVRLRDEVEQSKYAFGQVDMPREAFVALHRELFDRYYGFTEVLLRSGLVLPALEHCLKCSHLFNVLDASGGIGVTERTAYILRVRQLAVAIAKAYAESEAAAQVDATSAERERRMDRELLIELGCEELPAGWLPPLTQQFGEAIAARLKEFRLSPEAPVETYSTPRRLTARIGRVPERQTDLEDLLMGPPVTAAFKPDGAPTPAAAGFARKNGVEVADLEHAETPKGAYLAFRKKVRGKPAIDVLPDVLGAALRDLSFPKQMHWDAMLDDGRGELLFGRPIRWILYLYGGRVVPFVIGRLEAAQSSLVQDVRAGAVTYGHRFLVTSGRAGRAIKVRSFDEYQTKLVESFVVLNREERHAKIARELDAHARRLGGRVSSAAASQSRLLQEVPDLVEYPSVVAGTYASEFLELPEEVLTTTMIHHQHFFPVVNENGRLIPAFLAVVNTEPDNAKAIARNLERVLIARLRDARFFWDADRRTTLEAHLPRLDTVLFHKRLGSYHAKAMRIERLAGWVAQDVLCAPEAVASAKCAARLAKVDLATDMVRELTELQGTMGGIYAREEGQPEEVWRSIYYHYLPQGIEPTSPPSRVELKSAATTWAAVSIADKLDTIVGLFAAGERPTGTRDPFGLRRQAQGLLRLMIDLPELTGLKVAMAFDQMLAQARAGLGDLPTRDEDPAAWQKAATTFLLDRLRYIFEQRGFAYDELNALLSRQAGVPDPLDTRRRLESLRAVRGSADFEGLAVAFKRVKNLSRELHGPGVDAVDRLTEPAEVALMEELGRRATAIRQAIADRQYDRAFQVASGFRPAVDAFFTDIFVMVEDQALRTQRLSLLRRLHELLLELADISEIVPAVES